MKKSGPRWDPLETPDVDGNFVKLYVPTRCFAENRAAIFSSSKCELSFPNGIESIQSGGKKLRWRNYF